MPMTLTQLVTSYFFLASGQPPLFTPPLLLIPELLPTPEFLLVPELGGWSYPSEHPTPFVAVLSVVDDGSSSLPVVGHQYYLLAVVHDDLDSYVPGAVSVDLAHCRSDPSHRG